MSTLLCLSESEKKALAEIKQRISAIFPVKQFILYGSKARGDAEPDSDVDLLIITKRELSWQEHHDISSEIFKINLKWDTNFSMVDVNTEEWDHGILSVLPFHDSVAREGIRV